MNTLCVIIARGGSKGLVKKNLRPLAGKPLVAWSLEHALAARRVDVVALTSDCDDILAVGRGYGVELVHRPPELASDTATVDSAVRHAVQVVEHRRDVEFANVVILYGNIPLRPADLTDRAVAKLMETEADSVQSVSNVGKMHPFWMKKLEGHFGDVLAMYQDNRVYRRQDLPPVHMLDGGIIAVTRRSLFTIRTDEPHAFLGEDRRAVVTAPGEVVDVDTELDLRLAEAIVAARAAGV